MPMPQARANAISDAVIAGQTYPQIAERFYPNAENPSQTVYNCLAQPTVSALIAQKQAKIHSIDELKQIASKRIEQFDKVLSNDEALADNIPLLGKEKDYLELQGRFQGAFVDKSININIDLDRSHMSSIADSILNELEQGRGDANTGDSASLT